MSGAPSARTSPVPATPIKEKQLFRHSSHGSPRSPTLSTSPTSPVRSFTHSRSPQNSYHGKSSSHGLHRAASYIQTSPQLSERDSIFADHYVHAISDPMSPPAEVATRSTTSKNDSLTKMPSSMSLKDRSPPTTSSLHNKTSKISEWFRKVDASGDPKFELRPTLPLAGISKVGRRFTNEGYTRTKKSQASNPPQVESMEMGKQENMPKTTSPETRSKSVDLPVEEMSTVAEIIDRGSSLKQAMQSQRTERSVSRGRSHVDKSIEATVKKPETGGAARSRKASHMMGIFDTRATSKEQDNQLPDLRTKQSGSSSRARSPTIEGDTFVDSSKRMASPRDRPRLWTANSSQSVTSTLEAAAYLTQSPIQSPPVSPLRPEHDPYFRHQDLAQAPKIPSKLLEEIRDAYKDRVKDERRIQSVIPQLKSEDSQKGHKEELEEQKAKPEHEEDEEHISAAIYYPHPGPTAEEIEKFISPGESVVSQITIPLPDLVTTLSRESVTAEDGRQAEHIDISVVSKHDKKVFHGNYQPSEEVIEEDMSTPKVAPVYDSSDGRTASASESDLESGDDLTTLDQSDELSRTPTQRRSPIRKRAPMSSKPKTKVVLEPYKHQVGGHSTMFRFSKRAVCKQLNNRENEFYERIEQRHPDMLKFLPRYIGVLNVTFSKGPKNTTNDEGEAKLEPGALPHQEQNPSDSEETKKGDNKHHDPIRTQAANSHPRIVSHSQQIDSIPEVIIAQNKHLIPSDYYELPERPRSVDPNHGRRKSTDLDVPNGVEPDHVPRNARKPDKPKRPSMHEHSPSWGSTSVNSQLKEKVLRDVFGPPLIQYQKRHSASHSTLPRVKESISRRRSNLSVQCFGPGVQQSSSQEQLANGESSSADLSPITRLTADALNKVDSDKDAYSSSASAFDEIKHGLERVHTAGSIVSNSSNHEHKHVRRRHSGMSLRRRRKSVSGNDKPDLEYIENEAFSEEIPDDVFVMESATEKAQDKVDERKDGPAPDSDAEAQSSKNAQISDQFAAQAAVSSVPVGEAESRPINPKDAQSSNSNDRVAYFILLEDLTSGMGRPCVLDLKMGTRQYGVEATKKKKESQQRKCKTTTSQQLGVRVCGMQTFDKRAQKSSYEDKYFGRDLKAGREFREALTRFLYDGVSYSSVARHIPVILHKLSKLESMVRRLPGYRFYASSLLMLYDAEPEKSKEAIEASKNNIDIAKLKKREDKPWPPPIDVKLVDFANCVTGEDELPSGAEAPPAHPEDVDRGYLRGLRTLKVYFERILNDIKNAEYVERGEGEGMAHEDKEVDSLKEGGLMNNRTEAGDDGEVSF